MPTISQAVAASYPLVLADKRKSTNQWNESAFLRELERQGAVVRRDLGPTIECPLDYKRNPGTDFLATDTTTTSLSKTDVLTAASFTPAGLSVPIVWTKMQEAQNPLKNQKIALVKDLISNGIDSHDDAVEEGLFAADTDGFLGLPTHIPTSGQGSDGGIDAATDVFWRNHSDTYSDENDLEVVMTYAFDAAAKGSGSSLAPRIIMSGAEPHSMFEGIAQLQQRYVDSDDLKAGFKVIAFKTARYVFSQYGDTKIYFLNPKSFQLVVSKEFFRAKGETYEIDNIQGYGMKIYSALQTVTNNKSRLAVIDQA